MDMYKDMDTECFWGRHNFVKGFCTRCKVDQNNLIHIHARRWFNKTYGNTYHTVVITMPDGTVLKSGEHYGYGDQWQETAKHQIQKHFHVTSQEGDRLNPYLTTIGYYAICSVEDVRRKRDL
jgi:hypothetical protein